MLRPGLPPHDPVIEKRIDSISVNPSHRRAALAAHRHALATIDAALQIVGTLRRLVRTVTAAPRVKRGADARFRESSRHVIRDR